MNLFVTSLFINILTVAIWKSRQAFRAYGWGNMPLQAVILPMSHNNVVGENTVLQLNILETGVLTLVAQNSSPTRLRLVGDELWTTRVRTPVSKMFRWRTYNSGPHYVCEKCNKRVGSNWVICTMCVEDRVHGCHRKYLRLYDPGHSYYNT